MAEFCPFTEDCEKVCPMGDDLIEVSGVCSEDGFGETCAPVAGYGALIGQYDRLQTADIVEPIVARFTLDAVPEGYPPQHIREHWVGVEIPIRKPELLEEGDVVVAPADAILSLLRAGKLEAAAWFMASGLQLDYLSPSWAFSTNEGTISEVSEPISSMDFYGENLDSEIREHLEAGDPSQNGEDPEIAPVSVQGNIIMMHDQILMFPEGNHAGTAAMLAVELWRAEKISSLATLEKWLRQMQSSIHFVALPLDYYGDAKPGATTTYMGCKEGEPEYTVWIGVNGADEANAMLDTLGITQEENLERLQTTGMLTV